MTISLLNPALVDQSKAVDNTAPKSSRPSDRADQSTEQNKFSDIYSKQADPQNNGPSQRQGNVPAAQAEPGTPATDDVVTRDFKATAGEDTAEFSELMTDQSHATSETRPKRTVVIPDLPKAASTTKPVEVFVAPTQNPDVSDGFGDTKAGLTAAELQPRPHGGNSVETPTAKMTTALVPNQPAVTQQTAGQPAADIEKAADAMRGAESSRINQAPEISAPIAQKPSPASHSTVPTIPSPPPAKKPKAPGGVAPEKLVRDVHLDREPPVKATAGPSPSVVASQVSAAPQLQAYVMTQAQPDRTASKEKRDTMLVSEDTPESIRFDASSSSSGTSVSSTQSTASLARPELPRTAMIQLQQAVRTMSDQPIEITLNPQELGRVRLSITAAEGGVVLQILAERPETIDMMRRSAEELARELSDLGFTTIDLAFGQGHSTDNPNDQDDSGTKTSATASLDADDVGAGQNDAVRSYVSLNESGGVDMRV